MQKVIQTQERRMWTKEQCIAGLGWAGCVLATTMYLSLIDQILLNTSGHKGSWMLPLVGSISAPVWVLYGFLKKQRDWPIIACNIPGTILAPLAFITTFT